MPLMRYRGILLKRGNALATSQNCCCGCPCDGCAHCPDHCLTISQLDLEYSNCANCAYLLFRYPPTPQHSECTPDGCLSGSRCQDGIHNGRNCDWIDQCTWRLYGEWNGLVNIGGEGECIPSQGFLNCGSVIATLLNDTTWKFSVENGPVGALDSSCNPDPDCADNVQSPAGDVTLDVLDIDSFDITNVCRDTESFVFGPLANANNNAGSSANGCFSNGAMSWEAKPCCP